VSLTAATIVYMIDAEWSAAANAQAIMRAHQIGQTRAVAVRFVSNADALDHAPQRSLWRRARKMTAKFYAGGPTAMSGR
jgi:hypothetical protein